MCGIVATLPPAPGLVDRALDALRSRGPDGRGSLDLDFASLGVRRLAITDVAGGSQPLRSPSGHTALVFNGEIYNHRELRAELEADGHRFGSESDGEVILGLYERHGLAFADRLDGMFAIALADLERRRLVLAVDPLGVKPLYLAEWADEDGNGDWTRVAASTVDALPAELHPRVRRCPPGVVRVFDAEPTGTSEPGTRPIEPAFGPQGPLLDELRRSVRGQIPAEVPWAVLLSGGLDSGLIAALAAEAAGSPGEVVAYTVGLPGSLDVEAARRLASELGLVHRVVPVPRRELSERVEQVIAATATYDSYVVMSGVATWLAARAAAEDGVKVLLTGEGADELFAGYDAYARLAPEELEARLLDDQTHLGVTECLRLDRCTMAWGVEARVPFLSPPLVTLARRLPPEAKIDRGSDPPVLKLALREAAREVLPSWAAERPKVPFFKGAGLWRPLIARARKEMSGERLREVAAAHPGFALDSPLTAWFFLRWRRRFPRLGRSLEDLVSRGLVRSRER
jgi:asparagine synthase (glutamine-hydrolysing)